MTRTRLLIGLIALMLTMAACSSSDPDESTRNGDEDMGTTTEELVCGLVEPDLVRRAIGDAPIETRGAGLTSDTEGPAQCRILDGERTQTVMQLSIGVVDPAEWSAKLAQESASPSLYGTLAQEYSGDPGTGYGLTYDSGTFVAGAAVHVLKGDHLVRATVYNWADATPEERLSLAEDVARSMEANFAAAR